MQVNQDARPVVDVGAIEDGDKGDAANIFSQGLGFRTGFGKYARFGHGIW